jgi:hypothetical protein
MTSQSPRTDAVLEAESHVLQTSKARDLRELTAERDRIQAVCASAYQLAGLIDAPVPQR